MSAQKTLRLTLTPISPDTVSEARAEFERTLEAEKARGTQDSATLRDDLVVRFERGFPVDASIIVALTFASGIALEAFKALILPRLQKRMHVSIAETSDKDNKTDQ